jgi:hypothetical protein
MSPEYSCCLVVYKFRAFIPTVYKKFIHNNTATTSAPARQLMKLRLRDNAINLSQTITIPSPISIRTNLLNNFRLNEVAD